MTVSAPQQPGVGSDVAPVDAFRPRLDERLRRRVARLTLLQRLLALEGLSFIYSACQHAPHDE